MNNFLLTKETGLVLILDSFDYKSEQIYNHLLYKSEEFHIPFKLGIFNQENEFDKNTFNSQEFYANPVGNFITPLIEGFLDSLPNKSYDLLVFHYNPIYDIKDYSDYLSQKFNNIIIENLKEYQRVNDCLELIEKKIFDFKITELKIFTDDPAIPYNWPENFNCNLLVDGNKIILDIKIPEGVPKLNFDIDFRSNKSKTDVIVEFNSKKTKFHIDCLINYNEVKWETFNTNLFETISNHINNYRSGNFNGLFCPLCNKTHEFNIPLICNKQKPDLLSGIFSTGKIIIKDLVLNDKKFIIIKNEDSNLKYHFSNKKVIELDKNFFFLTSVNGDYYKIILSDNITEIQKLENTSKNFFVFNDNIYIIKLS